MYENNYLIKSDNIVTPIHEAAAYEYLWSSNDFNFKKISELSNRYPNEKLTNILSSHKLEEYIDYLTKTFQNFHKKYNQSINILINNTFDYPEKLLDAVDPLEIIYYSGNINLLNSKSIAIVGTRNPSEEGIRRARKMTKLLVNEGYTIVSGLAKGIDTIAHSTAIEYNGKTIAVIGTPIDEYYPKENELLQDYIRQNHLLMSQIPFIRYKRQNPRSNKYFFPERNKTMSAITKATIIIEAGETSGTLVQARAAIQQKRKLFILNSCFENKNITWPKKYEKLGAIRVRDFSDIITNLNE